MIINDDISPSWGSQCSEAPSVLKTEALPDLENGSHSKMNFT